MKLKVLSEKELQNKMCVIVGTRPGIIKFSPIIRELAKRRKDFFVIHTGQHYSYEMDKIFFEELELSEPRYKLLNVHKSRLHGQQTAEMLRGVEKALHEEKPKVVLVGGDANTNLAGALAARKLHIHLGHVEAGLRSNDWRMPEEHNRVMIDHISDFLFAPTNEAQKNLIEDNVRGKIFVTGNTIVDAIKENVEIARKKSKALEQLELKRRCYFLITLHREENVDFSDSLASITEGIGKVSETFDDEMVFPVHPRTRERIEHFKLRALIKKIKNLKLIRPLGYLDFLALLEGCNLVLTDSGGIQEESCILKVPCVTLRNSTERPETVEAGANCVVGVQPENIIKGVKKMLASEKNWSNPFGENASRKIVDIIEKECNM